MISVEALQESIQEASNTVQDRQADFVAAQARLTEAERELKLLVELAELRGVRTRIAANGGVDRLTNGHANGPSRSRRGRTVSPTRTALLTAVIKILTEYGEPMQVQDLMSAVQERGVAIPGSGQQANLIAHISRDDRIVRPRRGFYGLAEWGLAPQKSARPANKRRRSSPRAGARS